jgi:hypothetical protein
MWLFGWLILLSKKINRELCCRLPFMSNYLEYINILLRLCTMLKFKPQKKGWIVTMVKFKLGVEISGGERRWIFSTEWKQEKWERVWHVAWFYLIFFLTINLVCYFLFFFISESYLLLYSHWHYELLYEKLSFIKDMET